MNETVQAVQMNSIVFAILIGVIAGLLLAIVLFVIAKRKQKQSKKAESAFDIEQLLENQLVVDVFKAKDFLDWIDCQKKIPTKVEISYIVGRVNAETLPLFCVCNDALDKINEGTYYFMEAFETKNNKPLAVKLVNCSEVDDYVTNVIGSDNFAVYKDDEKK